MSVARSRDPGGRTKWFYHSDLSSCGRRAKRAGCGRVRWQNICLGHVPIAVRQDRQRSDAAAEGEEQLGRCAAERYYSPRRCISVEFESLADSSAAASSGPAGGKKNRTFLLPVNYHKREVNDFACVTHFWRGSPAAQPGAGVRRQLSCDGAHCPFLGPPRGQKHFFRGICNFVLSSEIRKTERGRTSRRHHNHHHAPEARFLFKPSRDFC